MLDHRREQQSRRGRDHRHPKAAPEIGDHRATVGMFGTARTGRGYDLGIAVVIASMPDRVRMMVLMALGECGELIRIFLVVADAALDRQTAPRVVASLVSLSPFRAPELLIQVKVFYSILPKRIEGLVRSGDQALWALSRPGRRAKTG